MWLLDLCCRQSGNVTKFWVKYTLSIEYIRKGLLSLAVADLMWEQSELQRGIYLAHVCSHGKEL